jgi:hypothetical protein
MMKYINAIILINIIFISSCRFGIDQIFFVPNNYKGYIILIHKYSGGKPKQDSSLFFRKHEYHIPVSGILFTDYNVENKGVFKDKMYYISDNGRFNTISEGNSCYTYSNIEPYEGVKFYFIGGSNRIDSLTNFKEGYSIYLISDYQYLKKFKESGILYAMRNIRDDERYENINNWNFEIIKNIKDSCEKKVLN